MGKVVTAYELAKEVKELRELQKEHLATVDPEQWGERALLVSSSVKGRRVDQIVEDILSNARQPRLFD